MKITAAVFQKKYVKKSEHTIQNDICNYAIMKNYVVIRFNSGAIMTETKRFIAFYWIKNLLRKYQNSGFPDVVLFKGQQYILIEVKKKGGKLSDSQKRFIELCNSKNVTVHVVDSLDEVIGIIDTYNDIFA